MNKKQKKVLIRIIISTILLAAFWILSEVFEINPYLEAGMFLIPYFIIG